MGADSTSESPFGDKLKVDRQDAKQEMLWWKRGKPDIAS
jgi:hypothetical protein